jgi:hypothetical protein
LLRAAGWWYNIASVDRAAPPPPGIGGAPAPKMVKAVCALLAAGLVEPKRPAVRTNQWMNESGG